jgi:hypothetical protein
LDGSVPDLRRQLAGLLDGTVSLVQFQRWLGLNDVAIELYGSDEDVDLMHEVAGLLDEYTGDYIDATEVMEALRADPLVQAELAGHRAVVA